MSNPLADASDTIERHMVDLTFEHKCDEKPIHKLSVLLSVQDDKAVSRHRKSDQLKMQLVVIHANKKQHLWMVRFHVFVNVNVSYREHVYSISVFRDNV